MDFKRIDKQSLSLMFIQDRQECDNIFMSQKCKFIIGKCVQQNLIFHKWDSEKRYFTFHHAHYDWWSFPIDQPSSQGTKYQVNHYDIPAFLGDPQFLPALRSNAILVCRAWGYDLQNGCLLTKVGDDQKWQRWPIRLYKMACSLQLFKQNDLHINAVKYGCLLIDRGEKFQYKKDLSWYFNQFRSIWEEKKSEEKIKESGKIEKKQEKKDCKFDFKSAIQGSNNHSYGSKSVPKPIQQKSKVEHSKFHSMVKKINSNIIRRP